MCGSNTDPDPQHCFQQCNIDSKIAEVTAVPALSPTATSDADPGFVDPDLYNKSRIRNRIRKERDSTVPYRIQDK